MKITIITNCNHYYFRPYHLCKRYSWQWHSILKYKKKLKLKSTLSLVQIVYQIFKIDRFCRMLMLLLKNRRVGIWFHLLVFKFMPFFFFFHRLFFVIAILTLFFFEGVPHMSTGDDEYNGFYIPKGTIIMGNVWLVLLTTTGTLGLILIFFLILEFLFANLELLSCFITRSILHDPKIFNNPHEFRPERFLKEDGRELDLDVRDPDCAVFGFGRRSV